MLGTIAHLLYSVDILNVILTALFIIYALFLIAIHGKCNDDKKVKIWNLSCLIPLFVSVIHMLMFTIGGAFPRLLLSYKIIYTPTILIALFPVLSKKKLMYNIGKVIVVIACIFCSILSLNSGKVANYSNQGLVDAYLSMCGHFEENYIMSEWKDIDYEALKKQYLPLVQEAEQTGDLNKYYDALNHFVCEFHDAHMGIEFYKDNTYVINQIKQFNDYGLSLIALDDGTVIAVDVEEGLKIKEGDVVTKWDGKPIEEAIANVDLLISDSLPENEKILRVFYLAGFGGETVSVSYINSDNQEATVSLEKMKDVEFSRVFATFNTFLHSEEEYVEDFFDYKMLNDNTGYLLVRAEETNIINDYVAYITGDNLFAKEQFRAALRELRHQGMTQLVIDVRNNSGGYDEVSTALASLFTKEEMYAFSLGIKDGDTLKSVDDRYVLADGEFSDIKVVLLTNMRCTSAGDGLCLYLSRLENVTIAGLTNPSGCNQETGGYIFMPGGVAIGYPTGLILDKDGNPNIDIDGTRESRNPVDIKIPLDKEAALKIFNGVDYELEWAIDYLNQLSIKTATNN